MSAQFTQLFRLDFQGILGQQFTQAEHMERESIHWGHSGYLHQHGGFLTIQPEEDWVVAAEKWSPGLVRELVEEFGVVYSTHTHGPHCRDPEGRLRSLADCNENRDWDQTPGDDGYPDVIEYVRDKYGGSEHVDQIITYGSMKARGVIRDV